MQVVQNARILVYTVYHNAKLYGTVQRGLKGGGSGWDVARPAVSCMPREIATISRQPGMEEVLLLIEFVTCECWSILLPLRNADRFILLKPYLEFRLPNL